MCGVRSFSFKNGWCIGWCHILPYVMLTDFESGTAMFVLDCVAVMIVLVEEWMALFDVVFMVVSVRGWLPF